MSFTLMLDELFKMFIMWECFEVAVIGMCMCNFKKKKMHIQMIKTKIIIIDLVRISSTRVADEYMIFNRIWLLVSCIFFLTAPLVCDRFWLDISKAVDIL